MTLRYKIFLPLVGLVLIFTIYLMQWWYPAQISEQVESHMEDEVSHLHTLGVLLVKPLLDNDLSEIYTTLDTLKLKNKNWDVLQLQSSNGTQLYPLDDNDFKRVNKNHLKLTHTIEFSGTSLALITLYYDTESIKQHITEKFFKLNTVLIAGLILFILFTLIIIELLVRYPLSQLSFAANQLRHEIYDTPLPEARSDEVGELIKDFNLMRTNISFSQQALKKEIEVREDIQFELQKRSLELESQKFALDQHSIVSVSNKYGQYTYVNEKFCEISGYSRDELIGMNQYMLLTQDQPESFFTGVVSYLKDNKVWHGEVTYRSKDRKKFNVEMTIVPFYEKDGEPYKFISILTDITHLKKIEMDLRKSTTQIQNILDSSSTILFSAVPSGDFTFIFITDNIETILGYSQDEIINVNDFWFDHIHPDDRDRLFSNLTELFVKGHFEDDYRFQDKSGNYHWVNNQLNIVYDSNGEPVEIIGSLMDITERRYVDEALRLITFATAAASDENFSHY